MAFIDYHVTSCILVYNISIQGVYLSTLAEGTKKKERKKNESKMEIDIGSRLSGTGQ